MIKAVIFDCFGVLSNVNLWHEFLHNLDDSEQIEKAKELNSLCDAGLISRMEFFDKIKSLTGKTLHDVETLDNVNSVKNQKLFNYLGTLKARNLKLGILSNIGSNWIQDEFLTDDEQALFDAMTMSYEAGTTKPDPEIYLLACNKLAVAPEEAVFIDDIEGYCEAARSLGMQAVHYRDFAQMKRDLDKILYHA